MNEWQADCKREYDSAKAQVNLKEHELRCAQKTLQDKTRKLRDAIYRDQDSWDGTPGLTGVVI